MKQIKRGGAWLAVLVLAGCATAPNWERANLEDADARAKALAIDHGRCTQVVAAGGGAPTPVIPAPAPTGPSSFTAQGQSYDQATGTWSTTQYRGQIQPAGASGFAGGFASGLSQGAALGAAIAAKRQREAIFDGCMASLGWTKKAKP